MHVDGGLFPNSFQFYLCIRSATLLALPGLIACHRVLVAGAQLSHFRYLIRACECGSVNKHKKYISIFTSCKILSFRDAYAHFKIKCHCVWFFLIKFTRYTELGALIRKHNSRDRQQMAIED
jgi:hypothetical protein